MNLKMKPGEKFCVICARTTSTEEPSEAPRVRFYTCLPEAGLRKQLWGTVCPDIIFTDLSARVCSLHFYSGRPSRKGPDEIDFVLTREIVFGEYIQAYRSMRQSFLMKSESTGGSDTASPVVSTEETEVIDVENALESHSCYASGVPFSDLEKKLMG